MTLRPISAPQRAGAPRRMPPDTDGSHEGLGDTAQGARSGNEKMNALAVPAAALRPIIIRPGSAAAAAAQGPGPGDAVATRGMPRPYQLTRSSGRSSNNYFNNEYSYDTNYLNTNRREDTPHHATAPPTQSRLKQRLLRAASAGSRLHPAGRAPAGGGNGSGTPLQRLLSGRPHSALVGGMAAAAPPGDDGFTLHGGASTSATGAAADALPTPVSQVVTLLFLLLKQCAELQLPVYYIGNLFDLVATSLAGAGYSGHNRERETNSNGTGSVTAGGGASFNATVNNSSAITTTTSSNNFNSVHVGATPIASFRSTTSTTNTSGGGALKGGPRLFGGSVRNTAGGNHVVMAVAVGTCANKCGLAVFDFIYDQQDGASPGPSAPGAAPLYYNQPRFSDNYTYLDTAIKKGTLRLVANHYNMSLLQLFGPHLAASSGGAPPRDAALAEVVRRLATQPPSALPAIVYHKNGGSHHHDHLYHLNSNALNMERAAAMTGSVRRSSVINTLRRTYNRLEQFKKLSISIAKKIEERERVAAKFISFVESLMSREPAKDRPEECTGATGRELRSIGELGKVRRCPSAGAKGNNFFNLSRALSPLMALVPSANGARRNLPAGGQIYVGGGTAGARPAESPTNANFQSVFGETSHEGHNGDFYFSSSMEPAPPPARRETVAGIGLAHGPSHDHAAAPNTEPPSQGRAAQCPSATTSPTLGFAHSITSLANFAQLNDQTPHNHARSLSNTSIAKDAQQPQLVTNPEQGRGANRYRLFLEVAAALSYLTPVEDFFRRQSPLDAKLLVEGLSYISSLSLLGEQIAALLLEWADEHYYISMFGLLLVRDPLSEGPPSTAADLGAGPVNANKKTLLPSKQNHRTSNLSSVFLSANNVAGGENTPNSHNDNLTPNTNIDIFINSFNENDGHGSNNAPGGSRSRLNASLSTLNNNTETIKKSPSSSHLSLNRHVSNLNKSLVSTSSVANVIQSQGTPAAAGPGNMSLPATPTSQQIGHLITMLLPPPLSIVNNVPETASHNSRQNSVYNSSNTNKQSSTATENGDMQAAQNGTADRAGAESSGTLAQQYAAAAALAASTMQMLPHTIMTLLMPPAFQPSGTPTTAAGRGAAVSAARHGTPPRDDPNRESTISPNQILQSVNRPIFYYDNVNYIIHLAIETGRCRRLVDYWQGTGLGYIGARVASPDRGSSSNAEGKEDSMEFLTKDLETTAALKIQHHWRQFSRRRESLFAMIRQRAAWLIQRWYRRFLTQRHGQISAARHHAAIKIQSHWRRYCVQHVLVVLRLSHRAAQTIQRAWRRYYNHYHNFILKRARRIQERKAAIVLVRWLRKLVNKQRLLQFQRRREAAMKLQRWIRGCWALRDSWAVIYNQEGNGDRTATKPVRSADVIVPHSSELRQPALSSEEATLQLHANTPHKGNRLAGQAGDTPLHSNSLMMEEVIDQSNRPPTHARRPVADSLDSHFGYGTVTTEYITRLNEEALANIAETSDAGLSSAPPPRGADATNTTIAAPFAPGKPDTRGMPADTSKTAADASCVAGGAEYRSAIIGHAAPLSASPIHHVTGHFDSYAEYHESGQANSSDDLSKINDTAVALVEAALHNPPRDGIYPLQCRRVIDEIPLKYHEAALLTHDGAHRPHAAGTMASIPLINRDTVLICDSFNDRRWRAGPTEYAEGHLGTPGMVCWRGDKERALLMQRVGRGYAVRSRMIPALKACALRLAQEQQQQQRRAAASPIILRFCYFKVAMLQAESRSHYRHGTAVRIQRWWRRLQPSVVASARQEGLGTDGNEEILLKGRGCHDGTQVIAPAQAPRELPQGTDDGNSKATQTFSYEQYLCGLTSGASETAARSGDFEDYYDCLIYGGGSTLRAYNTSGRSIIFLSPSPARLRHREYLQEEGYEYTVLNEGGDRNEVTGATGESVYKGNDAIMVAYHQYNSHLLSRFRQQHPDSDFSQVDMSCVVIPLKSFLLLRKRNAERISAWTCRLHRNYKKRMQSAQRIQTAWRRYLLKRTYYLRRHIRRQEEEERLRQAEAERAAIEWQRKLRAGEVILFYYLTYYCRRLIARIDAIYQEVTAKLKAEQLARDAQQRAVPIIQRLWRSALARFQLIKLRRVRARTLERTRREESLLLATVKIQSLYYQLRDRIKTAKLIEEMKSNADRAARVIQRNVKIYLAKCQLAALKLQHLSMYKEYKYLLYKSRARRGEEFARQELLRHYNSLQPFDATPPQAAQPKPFDFYRYYLAPSEARRDMPGSPPRITDAVSLLPPPTAMSFIDDKVTVDINQSDKTKPTVIIIDTKYANNDIDELRKNEGWTDAPSSAPAGDSPDAPLA